MASGDGIGPASGRPRRGGRGRCRASRHDSLDEEVRGGAAELQDILPGLGVAGDGRWRRRGPRRLGRRRRKTRMRATVRAVPRRFLARGGRRRRGAAKGGFRFGRGSSYRWINRRRARATAWPWRGHTRERGEREVSKWERESRAAGATSASLVHAGGGARHGAGRGEARRGGDMAPVTPLAPQ